MKEPKGIRVFTSHNLIVGTDGGHSGKHGAEIIPGLKIHDLLGDSFAIH